MKQGCILSPILFSMFINDFAEDLRSLGKGIQIDSSLLSCLMYADDIVVFAENVTYNRF